MLKRLLSLIFVVILALAAAGCSSMLEKEYMVVTEYKDDAFDNTDSSDLIIRDYDSLRNAIGTMIVRHNEQARFRFNSYEMDGEDIESDLNRACNEARTATPLASYAVEYISSDPRRIVAYYEVDIYISYRRTQEQVDEIIPMTGIYQFRDYIELTVREGGKGLVGRVSSSMTMEDILGYISEAQIDNPLEIPIFPVVELTVYSGTGVQKIYELSFDYGMEAEELAGVKRELSTAVAASIEKIDAMGSGLGDAERALNALEILSAGTEYDRSTDNVNSTAYGALVGGIADAKGFSLAYKALCDALELECLIVSGHYEKANHYWNIIRIGDDYYHVDAALSTSMETENIFLRSDEQMWGSYIWEVTDYPLCEGELGYPQMYAMPETT